VAQRYLPEVVESGGARILLIDGEPVPHALVRFAPPGDHRANMSVGARTETRPLTTAEQRICELVGPVLREMGLVFVGIDVIRGGLTEINVTSPTGIRELDRDLGINVAARLLDAVQSKVERG
jgi:glutathione synthase